MADITTNVLIIGTGPAGAASAALLSGHGIANMAVNQLSLVGQLAARAYHQPAQDGGAARSGPRG